MDGEDENVKCSFSLSLLLLFFTLTSLGRCESSYAYKEGDVPKQPATHNETPMRIYDDDEFSVTTSTESRHRFVPPDYCKDLRPQCHKWAAGGGCELDPDYMLPHCPVSCHSCELRVGYDIKTSERFGLIEDHYDEIKDAVGRDIGVPQLLFDEELGTDIAARVSAAQQYVQNVVMQEDRYIPARLLCKNYDARCGYFAVHGDCESDEIFMLNNCAPVCFRCDFLHVESMCPIDLSEKNDLNAMFGKIVSSPSVTEQYDIRILSRPEEFANSTLDDENTIEGPWVLVIDNFLNATEAERLIQLGSGVGYERSTDVTGFSDDGSSTDVVSESRTSTNAWCNTESCLNDPTVVLVQSRMEQLTSIPKRNSESLQLLRYEPGQFYRTHHDFITYERKRRQGVRILTIFFYLNEVEEGGQTDFPKLKLSVTPKLGRALIWPSVYDEDPNTKDVRTEHRANTVVSGIKYGANAWLHQREVIPDCNW